MKTLKITKRVFHEIAVFATGLLFVSPILFLFMNTFKTQQEMFDSFLSLPQSFYFDNYIQAWNGMHYLRAFFNTLIVTFGSVSVIIVFSSMAAYRIARSPAKWASIILFFFILVMMLPFQTIMIPLMQVAAGLSLTASRFGYILIASALFCPFTIYLYRGFCKQVPIEIEEAAKIDGASALRTFFIVVFPLLKPVTITAIIINTIGIWNDYVLAMLLLQRRDTITLTISVVQYVGRYSMEWHLIITTLAIVILPVIILYLCLQNSIQNGLLSGSLKG